MASSSSSPLAGQLIQLRNEASHPDSHYRLSNLLSSQAGPWPAYNLILTFQDIYKALPEHLKANNDDSIRNLRTQVKRAIPSIGDLIGTESRAGLIDATTERHLTHAAIRKFVQNFHIRVGLSCNRKPRVAVILPNGPLMAIAVLSFANRYTMVPMASNTVPEQLHMDIEQVQADAIVALDSDIGKLRLAECNRPTFGVEQLEDMTFRVVSEQHTSGGSDLPANTSDDIAIILFTSGTSGNKKLVPITTYNLVSGTMATMESVELTKTDTCLNMMPLNHVGGIIRSIFSPLLAGGATICCPSFDPSMFWDAVESPHMTPTWYYATPTMHQMILGEANHRPDAVKQSVIQFICNAGAGLPPSLAMQLREMFHCVILPSYGMTECMPIAAPPKNYTLDRHGTSGRIVGPDVAILTENGDHVAETGMLGHICIRGSPAFEGYLTPEGKIDASTFNESGWFDTGDLGYLDADNYLYITGRSKEVINRGGEIISPVEVEDAVLTAAKDPSSPLYGRVTETLAFSVPDEVLQEVVGAVIVTSPGTPRPDLRQVHEALHPIIHQPKWPALLVYMDRVPKSNNKIQRIKLAQRLALEALTPTTPLADRHYEATCPPNGTPLSASIPKTACVIDNKTIHSAICEKANTNEVHIHISPRDGFAQAVLFGQTPDDNNLVPGHFYGELDGYLIPGRITSLESPMPVDAYGNPDQAAIDDAIRAQNSDGTLSPVQRRVRETFATALSCAPEEISASTDFFAAGGDSLSAGRLVSQLRRELGVFLAGDILFHHSTVGEVEQIIDEAIQVKALSGDDGEVELPGCEKTYSSTNPILLLLHLIPITFFFPMKRAFQWLVFAYVVATCSTIFPIRFVLIGRLVLIVLAVLAARIAGHVLLPLCGITFKWLVIGRYKEGISPMWGPYHTRWWLTQKALQVCGKGMFSHFDWSRALFYRLLGAKIGKNVSITKTAKLGEYDLIEIGDNVILDNCQCRPFAVERNTSMLLKRIQIGKDSSVGTKSLIAPGAIIPNGTCIGPNSSSWELKDADESNRDLLTSRIPKPHWILSLLIVEPIRVVVWVAARLTWMGGLVPMVRQFPAPAADMFLATLEWYTSGQRIGYHITARICRAIGGPIVLFITVLIFKTLLDIFCGKPKPGPASKQSTRQKVRAAVLAQILPSGDIHELTRLVGRHYELVSMAVRALGGKVGKRVYWPSVGPALPDFDLVEIGNDVVFGSRSTIITSDGYGRDRVVIGDGTMVGDRVVASPGVTIGRDVMIGSGALLRRNGDYPSNTIWTGSKGGDAVQFPTSNSTPMSTAPTVVGSSNSSTDGFSEDEKSPNKVMADEKQASATEKVSKEQDLVKDTCKPFGRAFYRHEADYYVLRIWQIVIYSVLSVVITTVYWLCTVVFSLLLLRTCLHHSSAIGFTQGPWRPFVLFGMLASIISGVSVIQSFLALGIVISIKWMVMGRRMEGAHHWDKTSYNQRWQFLLSCETLIKDCYGGCGLLPLITGSAYISWYYRLLGANIGKDCAIHANGTPNVFFTEPDLITLGNRVAVDDASVVCHLNSRGEFELHPLTVGDRSILRAGSRLMSGASMGQDACILEHTLVLSGDHVEDGGTLQGWPAEGFQGKRA
ncbi:NRPS-like protein biosynthetic cluster [Penicillium angulare]|uniref:NRPS-like protein biosynthetic cluster n=1 Tax=Penicillium angulare TaxID=116970 RepID=UPI002540CBA1|nr:NRPS-like protein biosynthetic cluster [Penicillium angulare]KAJ5261005.1 NRPS-like protein biosynthetic cluster [Penicillium angulare]